jgi:DNA-binding beta-propeller fold protein YncE
LVVAALLMLLAACGGESGQKKAAEPESAPTLTAEPAGTTRQVGAAPQGIVYDQKTDTVTVSVRNPDRLLVLDPRTLRTRRTVPLPGKVRHLQVTPDGGTVLVPSEKADTFLEVDPTSGVTRTTKTRKQPHDAAGSKGGDMVVAEEFAGSLAVVRDGSIRHRFDDLKMPGGVVVDGRTAVVVDVGEYTLTTYDLDSLERLERVPAGKGPTHVALIGGGRVAVTDTRGDRVLVFDVRTLRPAGRLSLDGNPYGIAADPTSETLWVTLTGQNELVGLDVGGETPREIARYPTSRQPNTVAVDPGARTLWVTGTKDGTVQRIER